MQLVEDLLAQIDSAAAPLVERHAAEAAELDARIAQFGERGSGRKLLEERHRRELRRHRTDELRSGLAVLAGTYRDGLANGGGHRPEALVDAVGRIHRASRRSASTTPTNRCCCNPCSGRSRPRQAGSSSAAVLPIPWSPRLAALGSVAAGVASAMGSIAADPTHGVERGEARAPPGRSCRSLHRCRTARTPARPRRSGSSAPDGPFGDRRTGGRPPPRWSAGPAGRRRRWHPSTHAAEPNARSNAGIPPTSTPISGIGVNTATAKPRPIAAGRSSAQHSHPMSSPTDDRLTERATSRYSRPRRTARCRPRARRRGAPRGTG